MFNDNIVFSVFRQGAGHKPENKPCQDYGRHFADERLKIIALSDGHGGNKYFRSQEGARIASQIAIESLQTFCQGCDLSEFLAAKNDFIKQEPIKDGELSYNNQEFVMRHLFQHICSEWHRQIREHFITNPFSKEEIAYLQSINTTDYYINTNGDVKDSHLPSAYGCTLMAVAATPNFWLGIHIGDGKCVAFNEDGTWYEPIPWDENCFQNLTTSLSKQDYESFRYCIGRKQPAAIFIGSDGMDDSYQPMEALADCYGNYFLWPMLQYGVEKLEEKLSDLLDQISTIGSKDDMSIGFIVDLKRLPATLENFIQYSLKKVNSDLTALFDDISDLNIALAETKETIKINQQIINNHDSLKSSLWDELNNLEVRYRQIEKTKPSLNSYWQKLLDFISIKTDLLKKETEINQQLDDCVKKGQRQAALLDKCETDFEKASKEINQLVNRMKVQASKIERLQQEVDQLNSNRKKLSERLEYLRNTHEV